MCMFYLSQRDKLWADAKLGASNLTCGSYGCTSTSLSMLSSYFGCYKSPLEIAHNAHNYTPDGLVIWKNLSFNKMKFDRRAYSFERLEVIKALRDSDRAVLLEVQLGKGRHWLAGVKYDIFGRIIAVDPWLLPAQKVDILKKYGVITGAAYFSRK